MRPYEIGRDGIAGLVGLAVSLTLLPFAFGLPKLPIVPIGPGFYPALVLAFMAAMSAVLLVQDLVAQRQAPGSRDRTGIGGAKAQLRARPRGLCRGGDLHRAVAVPRLSHCDGFVRGRLPGGAGTTGDVAPVGHPTGDRGRHGGGYVSRLRAVSVSDPAAWQLDRLVTHARFAWKRSRLHPAVEIHGALVPGHAGWCRRRVFARSHDHHDGDRDPAVYLRA